MVYVPYAWMHDNTYVPNGLMFNKMVYAVNG